MHRMREAVHSTGHCQEEFLFWNTEYVIFASRKDYFVVCVSAWDFGFNHNNKKGWVG